MDKELGLSSLRYQQGLAAFYPLYIAAEIPSNLVLKKVTPRIWIALMTFLWGLICMCLGFVRNFDRTINPCYFYPFLVVLCSRDIHLASELPPMLLTSVIGNKYLTLLDRVHQSARPSWSG